jgi:hypothetical protein
MALPLKALYKHYGTWVTQRQLTLAILHAPDLTRFGPGNGRDQKADIARAVSSHSTCLLGLCATAQYPTNS